MDSTTTKDNTRMLPSISNLLISSPYSNQNNNSDPPPPTLNLSPASPILSYPSTPPHTNKSPSFLSLDNNNNNNNNNNAISPILSPISSPSSSPYLNGIRYLSLKENNSQPPLEGDDPPQRLRLPSPSSNNDIPAVSPKHVFYNNNSPTTHSTWSTKKTFHQQHHSPTPSCSSLGSFEDTTVETIEEKSPSPSPPVRRRSHTTDDIPNTQIVFDATGQPILKRRRGRPPTCNNNFESGGWTFLTPTVWDIHVSEEQKQRELKADNELLARQTSIQRNNGVQLLDDTMMHDSMNAFTNSNMDTLLQMPRKKRGRKPKTHIAGNSCFVWKDLTSTRSSNTTTTTTKK